MQQAQAPLDCSGHDRRGKLKPSGSNERFQRGLSVNAEQKARPHVSSRTDGFFSLNGTVWLSVAELMLHSGMSMSTRAIESFRHPASISQEISRDFPPDHRETRHSHATVMRSNVAILDHSKTVRRFTRIGQGPE